MARDDAVLEAIDRWMDAGLIPSDLAGRLRDEVRLGSEGRTRRMAQYAVAVAGGAVLLLAGGIFLGRGWSSFSDGTRTFLLGAIGVGCLVGGATLERTSRTRPVGYLLQTVGLSFLLFSYGYSDRIWDEGSAGAFLIGALALLTPVLTAMRSLKQSPVMPAVNTVFGYLFVAMFLDRVGLDEELIVWVLDGVMLVSLLAFFSVLRRSGPDTPGAASALYALITSLFAGLVLVGLTAAGPLHAGDRTILALDLWLVVILAVQLWAQHRAPEWMRREWYDELLGGSILLAAVFSSITLDVLGLDSDFVGFGAVAVGALAIAYALRHQTRAVLLAGCLAIVGGVWHFGLNSGETLGTVTALAVTGGLLFWVSARLGRPENRGRQENH